MKSLGGMMTETQQVQLEYWTAFVRRLEELGSRIKIYKPQADQRGSTGRISV